MTQTGSIQTQYPRLRYPAKVQTFGTDAGRPKSGYFSLHFTYPDTAYGDPVDTTFAAGGNSQGMQFLIRTPAAGDITDTTTLGSSGEDTRNGVNLVVVDLKRAAEANTQARADGSCPATVPILTYDLGTEEATRMIAAAINSSRNRQVGEHSRSRYLRARYVKMSGAKGYSGEVAGDADTPGLTGAWSGLATLNQNPYVVEMGNNTITNSTITSRSIIPTDIPTTGSITAGAQTLYYNGYTITHQDTNNATSRIAFTIYKVTGGTSNIAGGADVVINNDTKEQHTIVATWESETPTGGGYWGTANGGPIVQGLGTSIPVWHLTAKPMDGGNMGLPAINADSRGAIPITDGSPESNHTLHRGFSRFSIEGLNSCQLPSIPPPDYPFDGPSIMGQLSSKTFGSQGWAADLQDLPIEPLEHGVKMDGMGPYPSGAFVSAGRGNGGSNDNVQTNVAASSTVIKVLSPNADFDGSFKVGSKIYKADGTFVTTITTTENAITNIQKLNDTGDATGNVAVKAAGVARRKTGTTLKISNRHHGFILGASQVFLEIGGASTVSWQAGDHIKFKDGTSVGILAGGAAHMRKRRADAAYCDVTGSGGASNAGVVTVTNDPRDYFVVGEKIFVGGALKGTIKEMTLNEIRFTGSVTISNNSELQGEPFNDTQITFALSGGGAFVGNAGVILSAQFEEGLYMDMADHPTGTTLPYTKADFDDNFNLLLLNGTTINAKSNEAMGAVGSSGFTSYTTPNVPTTYGNAASICDANGDPYVIGFPSNSNQNASSEAGTVNAFQVTQFFKDIPHGIELFRQAITLTVAATAVELQNGDQLFYAPAASKYSVALESGITMPVTFGELRGNEDSFVTSDATNPGNNSGRLKEIAGFTQTQKPTDITVAGVKRYGFTDGSNTNATTLGMAAPFRTVRTVNSERVSGLQITDEARVWDNISVFDDTGQELVLIGGSPFGTVIKDYQMPKNRIDPSTGATTVLPSTPGSGIEPNLRIQLPLPEDIPGNIIVRSGHDRVQAWRNKSFGMGGLSDPLTLEPGVKEANTDAYIDTEPGGATQFDTHDRMLHFHPVRILHDSLTTQFGLTPNTTPGSVPSGTTRLFAAHRLTDHAERGSVLKDTINGADAQYTNPHNRIRFGRQGHHFVAPMTMRGTPISLRRQLHRSHGSAYSLMFEAETENKHFGFQSPHSLNNATRYVMDSIEGKGVSASTHSGSFASDGFPLDEEMNGCMMPFHYAKWTNHPKFSADILFAPGQGVVDSEGSSAEQAIFIKRDADFEGSANNVAYLSHIRSLSQYIDSGNSATARSGAIGFDLEASRTVSTKYTTSEEFMVNGFFVSQYALMGGRPAPIHDLTLSQDVSIANKYAYAADGAAEGAIYPRVATELATVPPLVAHDPELTNASAAPVAKTNDAMPSSSNILQESEHNDLALAKASDTASGAMPDAFLCTWLAEYSHPALFGTVREQFMTFRYRASGMPNSVNYPATKNLLLRNADREMAAATGVAKVALPFERLYAFQWLQNYGYNGLNAGGHGSSWGLRGASAVLMGNSSVREAHGTLELAHNFKLNNGTRRSRGEGIGDGLNPRKAHTEYNLVTGATYGDNRASTKIHAVEDAMVAVDLSRRLPVRAWGMRGASDAINMLSGDPSQLAAANAAQQAITNSARFDGGVHDTMQKMPTMNDGADWNWPRAYSGVERSVPIGMVLSTDTAQSIGNSGLSRLSNDEWTDKENRIGIGRKLGEMSLGLTSPKAMPAGVVDSLRTDFSTVTGGDATFLKSKTINTGMDPIIGLNHHSGDIVKAKDSVNAVEQTSAFGSTGAGFMHQKGNNLHLNAHPVDIYTGTTLGSSSNTDLIHDDFQHHFPAHGWGREKNMRNKNEGERGVSPIPLSEISDHRQVQSDGHPRLGLVADIVGDKVVDYAITSTKAISLNSDLAIGQQFPVLPSWVQQTHWTKYGLSKGGSVSTGATNPDSRYGTPARPNQPGGKPKWSLDTTESISLAGSSTTSIVTTGKGVYDHWAVRGSADLPPWGGVFILRRTFLKRSDTIDKESRRGVVKATSNTANVAQLSQPIRESVDYLVRMVRPLKMFGWTSEMKADGSSYGNQDGWLLGAYSTISGVNQYEPFTRDNRYGVFELDEIGNVVKPIGSVTDMSLMMEWPDANNRDEVWHLIPTANMLQHFKSDAARMDNDGILHSQIDARYSQSTHPGGGEVVSRSEATHTTYLPRFDPFPSTKSDAHAMTPQPKHTLSVLGVRSKITQDASTAAGGYLTVADGRGFPYAGYLIIEGYTGEFKYTTRIGDVFTLDGTTPATGDCETSSDSKGQIVRFGRNLGTDTANNDTTAAANSQNFLVSGTRTGYPVKGVNLFAVGETLHTKNGQLGVVASLNLTNDRITFTANIPIAIADNDTIRGTNNRFISTHQNILPTEGIPIAPTFIDNAVSIASIETDKWDGSDDLDLIDFKPNMPYRGLGHYQPNHFHFLTPQTYILSDGQRSGTITYKKNPGVGGLSDVFVDGNVLTETNVPSFLIADDLEQWKIAGLITERTGAVSTKNIQFRNLTGDSLSSSGIGLKGVRFGHHTSVGLRSSDIALRLLGKNKSLSGADVAVYRPQTDPEISNSMGTPTGLYVNSSGLVGQFSANTSLFSILSAHPDLGDTGLHSSLFVNRKTKGLFVMEVLRNLSQMDGHQLIITEEGLLIYSPNVFLNRGSRVGSSSGPQLIEVSAMLEMANHVIITGDKNAENEIVRAEVKDMEKIKEMGGIGADGVVRTVEHHIAGLKDSNLALRLAKSIMRRTEQGASLIRVEGLVNSTDVKAGEILSVDFSAERIRGEFVVFEATHDYTKNLTNLVIGQYEKGIEGLLADLQTATGSGPSNDDSRTVERNEIVLTAPVRVIANARIMTRLVNNTRMIIGGQYRNVFGTHQEPPLGNIGVSGGKTGCTKNGALAAGASTAFTITGKPFDQRFNVGDAVWVRNPATTTNVSQAVTTLYDQWQYVGKVAGSSGNSNITLAAANLVLVADGAEISVTHNRGPAIGQSKSVFYKVD